MRRIPIARIFALLPVFIVFGLIVARAQAEPSRILILGNTADIPAGSSFFPAFRQLLASSSQPIHLILAGDLVKDCEEGVPIDENLAELFSAVKGLPHVQATVLPGDRDWSRSGPDGYDCAQALESRIEEEGPDNMHWPLDGACPGPEVKELTPDIVLISLNTQWWNHPYRKPRPADAVCEKITPEIILEEIRDAIEENLDKYILIAGHFPPVSLGEYGGRFPLSAHLLPPVAGSFRVAYRQNIGTPMDLSNERFDFFANELQRLAIGYKGLAFISGHEANQQILNYRENYLINSGAPVSGAYSMPTRRALLSSKEPGFIELTYAADQTVNYLFHRWTGSTFEDGAERRLYQSPCQPALDTSVMFSPAIHCPEDSVASPTAEFSLKADSAVAIAGAQYRAGKIKKIILGPHYRQAWITPVNAPYLQLDAVKGGLQPVKRGGGRQTISLKLEAADGQEYVFRSVDKDPSSAFSVLLRNTIVTDVTRDQTSSQHPYGALVVAPLLDRIDILHASPQLYIMPPDPKLGAFLPTFSGMLGMLEERPGNPHAGRPAFAHADHIYKSHELFREILDDPHIRLDEREFARARVFDLLIGDWSKHEDNWKWAGFDRDDNITVRPIPRDRDHAFSNLDGLLPYLADRQWAVPNLENFSYHIKSVRSLTFQARHMDRFLTTALTRQDWLDAARYVQDNIRDEDIHQAISALPPPVIPVSGTVIEDKLKQRKKDLVGYANTFYELLAEQVDVIGTNEDEIFTVSREQNGTSTVERRLAKDGSLQYRRAFLPGETREIHLYGLHGRDTFRINGLADEAILVRVIGGPDPDCIIDQSRIGKGSKRTLIYEKDPEADFQTGEEARQVNHWKDELYGYDRKAFAYNSYLPLVSLGFNSFNGFSVSGGVSFTRRNFQKRDFSSKHQFNGSFSTLSNYTFQYKGHWHEVFRRWDVRAETGYGRPIIYNYFFGLGSQTSKNEELFRDDYYRFFINAYTAKAGLYRPFLRRSFFALNLGYEHNNPIQTENTILEEEKTLYGAGRLRIVTLDTELELDLRDHEVFPSRGIRLAADHESGFVSGNSYGVSDFLAEFFLTPHRFPITIGFQGGFSATSGQVPFYKQPSLGLQQGLRGFQRNRFTSDERLYWNTELRVPLGSVRTPIVPLKIGLRGFYDQGQVREHGEKAAPWRSAYGVGFYIIPLTRSYALSIVAGFSEEESGLIGFQLGTNF